MWTSARPILLSVADCTSLTVSSRLFQGFLIIFLPKALIKEVKQANCTWNLANISTFSYLQLRLRRCLVIKSQIWWYILGCSFCCPTLLVVVSFLFFYILPEMIQISVIYIYIKLIQKNIYLYIYNINYIIYILQITIYIDSTHIYIYIFIYIFITLIISYTYYK